MKIEYKYQLGRNIYDRTTLFLPIYMIIDILKCSTFKIKSSQQFVIPKGEKRPVEPPVVVKQEPVTIKQEPMDLDERAGSFFDQGAMEVPDFFSEAPPPEFGDFKPHKKHKKEKKKKKKHKHKKEKDGGGTSTMSSGASSSEHGSNPASPVPDLMF